MSISIQVTKGADDELNFPPHRSQRLCRRIKTTLKVCQGTAISREFIMKPFPDILSKDKQLIAMKMRIIPVKDVQRPQEMQVLHNFNQGLLSTFGPTSWF